MTGDRIARSKYLESLHFLAGVCRVPNRADFASGITRDSLHEYREYSLCDRVVAWGDPVPGGSR